MLPAASARVRKSDSTVAACALVTMLAAPMAYADRAVTQSAPAGLSRADWRQIQRALGPPGPAFLQDAKLEGHGDPGVGTPGAEAGYSVSVSGDTALVGAWHSGLGLVPSGSAYVFVRSQGVWSLQQELFPSDAAAARILPSGPTFLFGASVALSGDTAVVGAPGSNINAAYVFARVGTTWHEEQKLLPSGQSPVPFFGGSVSLSGDTLVVGANGGEPLGSVEGAAFVFVRSGTVWSEQQKLVASDGAADAYFGMSVSLDGDTAVVGAPFADTSGGANSGAAYVFVRAGTIWTEQQKLTASDGAADDLFGYSVSVSGDTAGVGAYLDDTPGGVDAGSAYVFARSGTAWTEQQKLTASDGGTGDLFGISVSISGDTAGVGAYVDNIQGYAHSGSAYVFVRSGTAWTEQQKLTAPDPTVNKQFGFAVSIDGDTLLAGAPNDTPVANDAGSAYVFVGSGTTWGLEQKLVGPDPVYFDQMGLSVSVSGETAVVGAPTDNTPGGSSAGSAYVFVKSGTAWVEEQKLTASDGASGDWFGLAVAISGDTVAVGAPHAETAYVFNRSGTVWSQQQKLTASDAVPGDFFGLGISVSGDTVLVGARYHDIAGTGAGAAYVFVRSGTAWSEQQKLTASDGAFGDDFGAAVAVSGDSALVGASYANLPGAPRAGAVYAFDRFGTAWTEVQKLVASDGVPYAGFGTSVSLSGDTALVGAPPLDEPGSAYAFVRSGSAWSEQQKLTASDGVAGDGFGGSVSVSGETALVGAPYAATANGGDAGAAYVFVRSGTAWSQGQKLTASDGAEDELFGWSVSLSGEIALLGAPGIPYPQDPTGNAAYVFRPHSTDLSVTKTDGQASAVPGSQVTYSILVANAGPDNVSGASVNDALPPILTSASWTCAASPGSSCGSASGTGGINDAVDLLVGGTATYSLTATVDPAAVGTLDNAALATVPTPVTDPNPSNDSALDSDTLTPQADLRLTLSDLPDPAGAGGLLTYTLQATNLGPSLSSGLTLSDALPPELLSAETIPGPPACTEAGGTVACNLPGLSPGETRNVTIRGLVNAAQGTVIGNSATISGNEPDPVAGNDSDTELTSVGPKAEADLVHGTTILGDLESVGGVPDEDLFRINQQPYSSYEVIVDATSGDIGAGSGPDLDRLASDATTVLQSAMGAGAGASRSLRWENDTPAAMSGEYLRVRSAGCTTTCDAADVYRIRSFDTTMLVPRFNNAGSQVTILLLQNTSGAALSGHASFWSGAGALVANQAFTLAPRAVFTVNSSSVPGAAGQTGSITVSHDGPYGALDGKAVAVEPATGFTFDTALEPRAR